jgi:catecholate siderophore receptor
VTVDSDQLLGDNIGARINVMAHTNDVPGRDVETYERWGVAPSFTLGLNTPTRFTLAFVHQQDDNIPQYGVPYALGPYNNGALPGAPSRAFYGYANVDRQEITADSLTAIFEHEFSDNLSVRNLTRYQEVSQLVIVDPPQGAWCVTPGINPWTGVACANPGEYQPSGPRGNTRDSTNEILINQTDLTFKFNTGGVRHTMVAGAVFSNETYNLDTGNVLRNPLGATPNPTLPVMGMSLPTTLIWIANSNRAFRTT